MKRVVMVLSVMSLLFSHVDAQEQEIEQLLLNMEKLAQFKQILKDMQDGYESLVKGYGVIKDLSEGNFNLHQAFLDGLLEVSPPVRKYYKIEQIITRQVQLTRLARGALRSFRVSQLFSDQDLRYVESIYERTLAASLRNIEDLTMVLTAGKMRMSDEERLTAIDRIDKAVSEQWQFIRGYNDEQRILLLQKAQEQKDAQVLNHLMAE